MPPSISDTANSGSTLEKNLFSLSSRQLGHGNSDGGEEEEVHWAPTFFRLGPFIGLSALALVVLLVVASFAVLKATDGVPVSAWQYQPSVYLAIFTAFSNKALAYALVQGTVISFWLHLTKGTTLRQAHRDWAYGLHVSRALLAGRHFNALALASICVTFVAIDGPLLQRASSVQTEMFSAPVNIQVAVAPEIPSYSTGTVTSPASNPQAWSSKNTFLDALSDQLTGAPIVLNTTGCPNTCSAKITAPALAIDYCESTYDYIDYLAPLSNHSLKLANIQSYELTTQRVLFQVAFFENHGTSEIFGIQTRVPDESIVHTCTGRRNTTTCYTRAAIGEYEVLISNGTVTLSHPADHPKILALANNTALTNETIQKHGLAHPERAFETTSFETTLGGIGFYAVIALAAVQFLYAPEPRKNTSEWHRTIREIYPQINLLGNWPWPENNFKAFASNEACSPAWGNPIENVIAAVNGFMFRTGVWFANTYNETYLLSQIDPGLSIRHNVTGTPQTPTSTFQSDFRYFAGAASLELLAVLVVMYTFYGWWRLGRDVSLSPIEIAKAFNAPLLQGADHSNTAREIIAVQGSRVVQYGTAASSDTEPNRNVVEVVQGKLSVRESNDSRALE